MCLRFIIALFSIALVGCQSSSIECPVQKTTVKTGPRFDSNGRLTDSPEIEVPILYGEVTFK